MNKLKIRQLRNLRIGSSNNRTQDNYNDTSAARVVDNKEDLVTRINQLLVVMVHLHATSRQKVTRRVYFRIHVPFTNTTTNDARIPIHE